MMEKKQYEAFLNTSIENIKKAHDDNYLEIGIHSKENQNVIDVVPETSESIEIKECPQIEQTASVFTQKQTQQEYPKSEQLRILKLEEQNLKTKARISADELEAKNRDLEIKKIELQQTLLAMGKVEEALALGKK